MRCLIRFVYKKILFVLKNPTLPTQKTMRKIFRLGKSWWGSVVYEWNYTDCKRLTVLKGPTWIYYYTSNPYFDYLCTKYNILGVRKIKRINGNGLAGIWCQYDQSSEFYCIRQLGINKVKREGCTRLFVTVKSRAVYSWYLWDDW